MTHLPWNLPGETIKPQKASARRADSKQVSHKHKATALLHQHVDMIMLNICLDLEAVCIMLNVEC